MSALPRLPPLGFLDSMVLGRGGIWMPADSGPILDILFTGLTPGVVSSGAWTALTGGSIARAGNNATVRSGTETVTDADADTARIYSDGGGDVGLLIEPSATTLAPHATDLRSSAGWSLPGCTEAADATLGPNGTSVTRFSGFGASGNSTYYTSAQVAKSVAYQFWYRRKTADCGGQAFCGPAFPGGYRSFDADATWRLFVDKQGVQTGNFQLTFSDFFGGARAGAGAAVDFLATLAQFELTRYPTSIIRRTAVAGTDVRNGDRYKWPDATVIVAGRLQTYFKVKLRAACSWLAAGTYTLLHGSNFDVTIDQATRVITVTANGNAFTLPAIADWAEGDTLECTFEFGGTSANGYGAARIGTDVPGEGSSGSPQGNLSGVSSNVDFFSNAGSGQIPMTAQRLTVYR